jgi:hypothetical protein
MVVLLLLFSLAEAAEELLSERYCFSGSEVAWGAQVRFGKIKVPSDQDSLDDACLVVQMRPHRRELIQKYLLSLYPDLRVAFSTADVPREPCKLRIEKVGAKSLNRVQGSASADAVAVGADRRTEAGTEVMEIETLDDFAFSVNQSEVKGTCRYLTPKRYGIVLEVRKNPKPAVPAGLLPGQIVVLNEPPPDQETSVLKTVVQLSPGEKVNVGEILRKSEGRDGSIDLGPGPKLDAVQEDSNETVFLMLQ